MSRCMQGSTKATIKLAKKGGEGPGGTGKGAHPVLSIVIESAVSLLPLPPVTLRSETDPLIGVAESNGKTIGNHSRCLRQGEEARRC